MCDFGETKSYLVECYWPGVDEEALVTATERARAASEDLRRAGRQVAFLESILVQEDETVFCLFTGAEADVRTASERAGMPYERVLELVRVDGNERSGRQTAGGERSSHEHD